MKLRPNNYQGHGKKIRHGILGKQKTYVNSGFKQLPEMTEEERKQKLVENLKPYSYDPKKHKAIHQARGPVDEPIPSPSITPTSTLTPTPSPTPPEQFYILTEGSDSIITEGSDNIVQEAAPNPSPTPTPTISVTPSITPSVSVSPTVTPSISVTPTITPSITPSASLPAFSPDDISGLSIWYDFDDNTTVTTSGTDITAVSDKSVNNFDLTAPTGAEPSYTTDATFGGNNVASFTGGQALIDDIGSSIVSGMTGHSFFFVFEMDEKTGSSQQTPYQILTKDRIHRFWASYYENVNLYRSHTESMEADFQPYTSFTAQYPYILLEGRVYDNGAGGSVVDVKLNDTAPSNTDTGAYDLPEFNYISIGARTEYGGQTDFQNGNWGELIFYNRALSNSERDQVVTYLKNKWNYTNW